MDRLLAFIKSVSAYASRISIAVGAPTLSACVALTASVRHAVAKAANQSQQIVPVDVVEVVTLINNPNK